MSRRHMIAAAAALAAWALWRLNARPWAAPDAAPVPRMRPTPGVDLPLPFAPQWPQYLRPIAPPLEDSRGIPLYFE